MIALLIRYAIVTIFILAGIDALRIAKGWGKTDNVDHKISGSLGIVAAIIVWVWVKHKDLTLVTLISWQTLFYLFGCLGDRICFYNISLNLWRRERLPDYTSTSTNNKSDSFWSWARIPFWYQILIGAGLLIAVIFVSHAVTHRW